MLWVMRCLALLHYAWGLVLVVIAAFLGLAALRQLPRLTSGPASASLPGILLLAASYMLPLGLLGLWMIVLGRWAWTLRPGLRRALLVTHGVLLPPGALAVAAGLYAVRAAERSAARGGGLLSPLAAVPLAFGCPVLALAICSIMAALAVRSVEPRTNADP